ncbi:MAG: helix-turn-helix transcriptional regulator [Steroidobacteraceae bacterium]
MSTSNTTCRLLRLPAVMEITGLSRSMIYLLESQNRFPSRCKITVRTVGWPEDEVRRWVAQRIADRPAQHETAVSAALRKW